MLVKDPGELVAAATERLGAGDPRAAESLLQCALREAPDDAGALHGLGLVRLMEQRTGAALPLLERARDLAPDRPEFAFNLGTAYRRAGRVEEAIATIQAGLALSPGHTTAAIDVARLHRDAGRLEAAAGAAAQGVAHAPDHFEARFLLAGILHKLGRRSQAIWHYRRCLAAQATEFEIYNNLGLVLCEDRQYGEAERLARAGLAIAPDQPLLLNNLGMALAGLGRHHEAIECWRRATDRAPGTPVHWSNLGSALTNIGDFVGAEAALTRALALDPGLADAQFNRGVMLLAQGRYGEGWAGYEWRLKIPRVAELIPAVDRPRWTGEPLDGRTLLVQAEQGMGDMIQAARYAPAIAAHGGRVILQCHPPLLRLLATAPGVAGVVSREEPPPDCDLTCPAMSLPTVLGTGPGGIPAPVPYLRAPPADGRFKTEPTMLNVGINWAGNPRFTGDATRSTRLERFLPLLEVPGCRFYSLHVPPAGRPFLPPQAPVSLVPWAERFGDLADTAQAVSALDLVVTTDTALAHVVGALGRPGWILLQALPDWRWGRSGPASPWYPTLRLFRQAAPGDWDSVFARVDAALRDLAAGHGGR